MSREKKGNTGKEGKNMALLAKSSNSMIKIARDKSGKFLEDSKRNTIKPEFLKECQEYAKLLNKGRFKK